ncbi:MAG: SpoIIE family protein phosphatase [Crocinitomicaceae bacterium]|nr:SpoIIE family protein phosphatase [Crocinitomicaceae bacterium]
MSNLVVRIFSNLSTRIMFIFYLSIILVTAFFLIFGYYTQLQLHEEKQHDKLKGIVSSVAIAIDGSEHEKMMTDFDQKDDIKVNDENMTYHTIHEILLKAVEANELKSPMYTLVYSDEKKVFEFGVTSDPNPYYRHDYTNYPQELIENMETGGTIPLYESENGMWLSAFYPIRNNEGKTISLLEADIEFTEFIQMVRAKYFRQSMIALGAIVLLALVLIPYTRKVLKEDELQKKKLEHQSEIIAEKNRDITDSINYALKIQNTILPPLDNFKSYFNDSFVLYKPKDIVAGDFFFLEKMEDYVYVAAADCTGHGVPGAMVSVICSNALSHAVHEKGLTTTSEILDAVRNEVVQKFKSSPDGIKDGMDVSICRLNLKDNTLQYTGANNPIYLMKKSEVEEISPDKQPVGQFAYAKPFTMHERKLDAGDVVYMFTDGFADQFGGEKGKKLKYKPFKEMLFNMRDHSLSEQMSALDKKFEDWKGDFEQVDDVCVIGFRV